MITKPGAVMLVEYPVDRARAAPFQAGVVVPKLSYMVEKLLKSFNAFTLLRLGWLLAS